MPVLPDFFAWWRYRLLFMWRTQREGVSDHWGDQVLCVLWSFQLDTNRHYCRFSDELASSRNDLCFSVSCRTGDVFEDEAQK
jgi:hypothetical protein